MKWKIPPKIKAYEALWTISDNRIELVDDEIRVYSSSRNKYYNIWYNEKENAIMTNDNGSFWQWYLGYPAIAYLMYIGKISYDVRFAEALKWIAWKDINQKFKNNWKKTERLVCNIVKEKGLKVSEFLEEIENIMKQIEKLDLNLLGKKKKPPKGY